MAETRWLTEAEMAAWQAFIGATSLLDRQLDRQLRAASGISHIQYEVLVRLAAAPKGEMRMSELADALFNPKSGLTYQVQRLEEAGLVRRRRAVSDERGIYAVLTAAGRKRLADAALDHVQAVREHFIDVLTPAQLTALSSGLGEVARRLAGG